MPKKKPEESQPSNGSDKPVESKSERFVRIAEFRSQHVVRRIRMLGLLANRSSYDYSAEQIEHMFAVLTDELRNARAQFERQSTRGDIAPLGLGALADELPDL